MLSYPVPTKSESPLGTRERLPTDQENLKLSAFTPVISKTAEKYSFSPTDNPKNRRENRAITWNKQPESKILTDSAAFVTEVSNLGQMDNTKKAKETKQDETQFPSLSLANETLAIGSLGNTDVKRETTDSKKASFKPLAKLGEITLVDKPSNSPHTQKAMNRNNASFDHPPRPIGYRLFESNIRAINSAQKPKQILQKKTNVNHVKLRHQSLSNKQANLNQSADVLVDANRGQEREYLSFKRDDDLRLFGTDEQTMLIESKAQLVARMESNSKAKNFDIVRYFIQKEKEKGILKRKTENVNIDPAFMVKKEQKKKELMGNTANRFIELDPNESGMQNNSTLKMLNDPHYRPYFKTGEKEYMMDIMNLSTIYRHRQIGDHSYQEVQLRNPYPVSAVRSMKPSMNTVKQMKVARQHRKLASRGGDDGDEEPPRIHSFKVG